VSSTTRVSYIDIGLPVIIIDSRRALVEAKELLRDPGQVEEYLSDCLKLYSGLNVLRWQERNSCGGTTVKIFMDNEKSATIPREGLV
jgi:hypothetical protein